MCGFFLVESRLKPPFVLIIDLLQQWIVSRARPAHADSEECRGAGDVSTDRAEADLVSVTITKLYNDACRIMPWVCPSGELA